MNLRGSACAAVVLMAGVACAPASETEQLPMQESGLVVEGDVREDATLVGEYAVTEEQLGAIQEACGDAEGVPLEAGEACPRLMELRFDDCDPPFEFCVRVYDVGAVDAPFAGYAEVVEGGDGSRCEAAPGSVCLRVGLSGEALTRVVEPSPSPDPTEPTTTSPSPTESSPTTESPTPSDSPSEPASDTPAS